MKKYIYSIVSVLSLVIFSACGGGEASPTGYQDGAEKEEISGVLELQESGDSRPGTHVLEISEDETMPLRSIAINLSDVDFLGNKVRISGFENEEDGVFEVTSVSVLEIMNEEDEDDEGEDGEITTFKSSYLGFQIDYLDSWELEELEDTAIFSSDVASVVVTQIPFYPEQEGDEVTPPLYQFFESYYPEVDQSDLEGMREIIGPDNLNALKLLGDDGSYDYFLYRNGLVYDVLFAPTEESEDLELILKKMISSFRFIGFKDETTDTRVVDDEIASSGNMAVVSSLPDVSDVKFSYFESLPYNFKGQYPASWYYKGLKSSEQGVLRHYEFSDEDFDDDEEDAEILLTVDVVSTEIPAGDKVSAGDFEGVMVIEGAQLAVYTEVNGQKYRVKGERNYEDIILYMASSIEFVESEDGE